MPEARHESRLDTWRAWIALGAGMTLTPTAVSGAAPLGGLVDPAVAVPTLLGAVAAALLLRPSGYVLDDRALRMRARGRRVEWPLEAIRRVDIGWGAGGREVHLVFCGGAVRRIPPRILPDTRVFADQLRARGIAVATL
ncbi:hypothetical protein BCF33_2044 [Hasllibacter halocynthiae]|uniref:Uncharacterized protein n=1 Tax=Hasllibacter halocynthiae TaxID=595589 RepID=A0A2T0X2L6_9RHOB|nr:hypothetical protein [Hasllibacter halocynthiae]PRY93178.1 hypothetical protein BCF33_2044 [Hasllibacter halocynthiae]